jgi:putative transposase
MLKFQKDRDKYFEFLREGNKRFRISILDYMITSNHIHLLVWAGKGEQISKAMQFVQGSFGQYYNKEHKRQGAFWRDRYHPTRIQSGEHFGRCLFYIDLNMVRAGAVKNIQDWKHTALHEFIGNKQRYRVIDQLRLLKCLGMDNWENFREWYKKTLQSTLQRHYRARQAFWSNSFAVGDREWLQDIYRREGFKRKKILPVSFDKTETPDNLYEVRESQAVYYIKG